MGVLLGQTAQAAQAEDGLTVNIPNGSEKSLSTGETMLDFADPYATNPDGESVSSFDAQRKAQKALECKITGNPASCGIVETVAKHVPDKPSLVEWNSDGTEASDRLIDDRTTEQKMLDAELNRLERASFRGSQQARIKAQLAANDNPTASNLATGTEKSGMGMHTKLAIAGAVPVVGFVADGVDLVLTAAEIHSGKSSWTDLGLSAISLGAGIIPIGGDQAAGVAKVSYRAERLASEAGDAAKATERFAGNSIMAFDSTKAVSISGKRAIDLGQSYEIGVRGLYGDIPFKQREFDAFVNGAWVSGIADNVTVIGGKRTAVEAKFVEDWGSSLRNPASQNGSRNWAVKEQQAMLNQAAKYSAGFDGGVIYHTNSPQLASYYSNAFQAAGISNFKFVITPVK